MDGAFPIGGIHRPAHRLSIESDDTLDLTCQHGGPTDKSLLKGLWGQKCVDTGKGVVGRDAIGEFQELLEPLILRLGPFLDFCPVFGPAEGSKNGDGGDVDEAM